MKFNVILFKHDIREYRQNRMARKLGISKQSFSERMQKPDNFRIRDYEQICKHLGKDPRYYFQ